LAALGLLAQASSPLDDCADAIAAAPARYESYLCYSERGTREGRLDEAAGALERLIAAGNDRGWASLVRGVVANERREGLERERAFYARAAERLAAAGEARGEVIARANLGRMLNADGDPAGARSQVALARRASEASTDPEARLRASLFEASQLVADGDDLERAHTILLKAEAAFPDAAPGLQMMVLRTLSMLSGEMGLHEDAIAQFERMLAIRVASGNTTGVPRLRFNLMTERRLLIERDPRPGDLAALRREAEETAASARALGDPTIVARTEAILAELWRREDPARAARHLERGERVARTLPSPNATIACLLGHAARDASRDPERADRTLDRAAELAYRHGSDGWIAEVARERVLAAWAGRSRAAAAESSLRALEILERLRNAQPEGETRIGLMRRRIGTYHWLAGRLLDDPTPDRARAFEVSERMRARVLEERLAARQARPAPDPPRRQQIAGVQKQLLDPALPASDRARLLDSLRLLELEERAAESGHPLASTRPIALAEAQARLADDELLLVYLVALDRDLVGDTAGGSWLMAISRDGATVHRLPERRALETAVPMFIGIIDGRDGSEATAAETLYRQLLGGVLEERGGRTRSLIVVPDGVLHALPFAALREHPDTPPLGARYAITTAPSVSLWARWKRLPAPQAGQGALVVASPLLSHASATADAVRGGILAQGLALGPLAYARREGARSRRAIGRDSRLLAGEQASEAALKRTDLRPFALLHFATHAVADDAFPDRSAVVLAAGSEDEDGLLQPREIAALGLDGRAVVLSACQTAAGVYVGGEGVMSLARSFFEGGARTVVAGLWRLRDDETERLMRDLYEGLAQGDTMGESLRAARARAVANGAPTAAWAGVVVLGDQDFALPPAPFAWWRVPAVLAPLTVAGAALWLAWRRRG
jgi:CHAT domain-containing protein